RAGPELLASGGAASVRSRPGRGTAPGRQRRRAHPEPSTIRVRLPSPCRRPAPPCRRGGRGRGGRVRTPGCVAPAVAPAGRGGRGARGGGRGRGRAWSKAGDERPTYPTPRAVGLSDAIGGPRTRGREPVRV